MSSTDRPEPPPPPDSRTLNDAVLALARRDATFVIVTPMASRQSPLLLADDLVGGRVSLPSGVVTTGPVPEVSAAARGT
jgi:hypothetical protein